MWLLWLIFAGICFVNGQSLGNNSHIAFETSLMVNALKENLFSKDSSVKSSAHYFLEDKSGSGFIELNMYDPGYCMVSSRLIRRITFPIDQCVPNLESLFGVVGSFVRFRLPNRIDVNGQFSGHAIGYNDDRCSTPASTVVREIGFQGVCNDASAVGNVTVVRTPHPKGRVFRLFQRKDCTGNYVAFYIRDGQCTKVPSLIRRNSTVANNIVRYFCEQNKILRYPSLKQCLNITTTNSIANAAINAVAATIMPPRQRQHHSEPMMPSGMCLVESRRGMMPICAGKSVSEFEEIVTLQVEKTINGAVPVALDSDPQLYAFHYTFSNTTAYTIQATPVFTATSSKSSLKVLATIDGTMPTRDHYIGVRHTPFDQQTSKITLDPNESHMHKHCRLVPSCRVLIKVFLDPPVSRGLGNTAYKYVLKVSPVTPMTKEQVMLMHQEKKSNRIKLKQEALVQN